MEKGQPQTDWQKTDEQRTNRRCADRRVKVLMVAGDMDVGGIENQMMHLLRSADRKQFQFDFTSTKADGFYKEEIEKLGGRWICIPRMNWRKPWQYCRCLKQVMEDGAYDVVHTHELFHSGLTLYLAWKAGIPSRVVHAHNWREGGEKTTSVYLKGKLYLKGNETQIKSRSSWGRSVYRMLMRILIRRYSTVQLYCSAWAGMFLYGKELMKKESCHLIYNSVDVEQFLNRDTEPQQNILQTEKKAEKWSIILHIGRITPVKNQIFLVELAAELKKRQRKCRILCVGDGDREEIQKIRRRIRETGTENYIRLLGRRRDIARLMHRADGFILPSLYEGMPLVMLEAQTAGLPCISADTYSRETDLGLGLIDWLPLEAGVTDWVDAIEKALEKKRIEWSIVRQAVIERGMDVKTFTDRICQIYQSDTHQCDFGSCGIKQIDSIWENQGQTQKIRLLFVISDLNCGGAQNALLQLLDHISRERFDITLYTIYPLEEERKDALLKRLNGITFKTVIQNGPPWKKHLVHGWFRFCMELGIAGRLYIHGAYDIEIAWLETEATKLTAQIKKPENDRRAKILTVQKKKRQNGWRAIKIAWVHCDMSERKKMKNQKVRERIRKQYDAFDRIVCVSEEVEAHFQKMFGQKAKTVVLHTILDADKIRKKAGMKVTEGHLSEKHIENTTVEISDYRLEKPLQFAESGRSEKALQFAKSGRSEKALQFPESDRLEKPLHFLAAGRLAEEKGYDDLIRACSRLKREGYLFDLHIIGEGPEYHRLNRMVERYHLEQQVKLMGFQGNPYPWIAACDLLICSSHYEGSSTVVREALILGTPVLTTACAGMRELIGDSDAGWIVEHGAEGLYKGMKNILDYREWLKPRAENAERRGNEISVCDDVKKIEKFFETSYCL